LITRALPLSVIALVAFVVGASTGAPGSPEKEAAERFADAWTRNDFGAMYVELNEASRRQVDAKEFAETYREAAEVATLRTLESDDPDDPVDGDGATVVPVPMRAGTVAFGEVEASLEVPYAEGGIAWDPSLVFPGLEPSEHLENRVDLAPRAPILARDGSALAEGPAEAREHPLGSAAIDVTGEVGMASEEEEPVLARHGYPPETPVGISGVEQAFNSRLAGKPGGSLLAVSDEGSSARIVSQAEPQGGAPVKTTIDPALQEEAVSALAGRAGGVAVLDARSGDVRALAGQAFSAPQPPGSTFKTITTTAALEKGIVSLDDEFEIVDGVNVGGRFISNANGEAINQPGANSVADDYPEILGPALDRYLPDGRLADYQKHKLRVYGTYTLKMGRAGAIDLSPIWRVDSAHVFSYSAAGVPLTAIELARNPGYPANNINANTSQTLFFGARGAGDFAGYGALDLAATYAIPVWKSARPWIKFEFYNALNNGKLVSWDTTVTPDPASAKDANGLATGYIKGANFGKPTQDNQYIQPIPGTNGGRLFRMALGIRF